MNESDSPIILREVHHTDVSQVVALVGEVLSEFGIQFGYHSETDRQLYELPHAYTSAGGIFFVAVDLHDAVLGTCGLYPLGEKQEGLFELRKMYVASRARGQHLGSRLLKEVLLWARSRGAKAIELDTLHSMHDAIRLYEKHGFVRDDSCIRGARCSRGYRLELS